MIGENRASFLVARSTSCDVLASDARKDPRHEDDLGVEHWQIKQIQTFTQEISERTERRGSRREIFRLKNGVDTASLYGG
jgi:hypothetical protein